MSAVICTSDDAYNMLKTAEKQTLEITTTQIKTDLGDEGVRIAKELYHKIGLLVSGEALVIVRSVTDMNGAEAWRRLSRRCQPDTPMRRLHRLIEIM